MATVEEQLQVLLANDVVILQNQADILSALKNQVVGNGDAALAKIEDQVADIQAQLETPAAPDPDATPSA